jgi:hypothetical protein
VVDKKKGLMTNRSLMTLATWIRSSGSAHALMLNKNSRSSIFSGTI